MGPNDEQAGFWDELTQSWLDGEQHSRVFTEPYGRAAMDLLGLEAGQRVLEVGCGSGATTIELAGRVSPGGSVVGVDIAPGMIEAARQRAEGVDGVEFRVADAQSTDLGSERFDAVFSRFGVMFFADPVVAFANLREALVSGGILAFACWSDLFANEWMFLPGAAVVSVTGVMPPMPGPGEPGPFSLGDRDELAGLLERAGFAEVTIDVRPDVIELPATKIDSMVELACSIGPAHEALRAADENTTSAIVAAIREVIAERIVDGFISLTANALVVSARR